MHPTPLFIIAASKHLAALAKTLAYLPLRWHFSKLVEHNEELPRHAGLGGLCCRAQRAHAPVTEHFADLPFLPSLLTDSQTGPDCHCSCAGTGATTHPNSRSQTCFSAMQITTLCQRQSAQTKQQMVKHLHRSSARAHLCFILTGQMKRTENPHLAKILPQTLHLNPPPSASSQIPEDKGLIVSFIQLSITSDFLHQLHPHHSSITLQIFQN